MFQIFGNLDICQHICSEYQNAVMCVPSWFFLFKVWLQAMAKILVHEIDSFCKVNCSRNKSAMIAVDKKSFNVIYLVRRFPPARSFWLHGHFSAFDIIGAQTTLPPNKCDFETDLCDWTCADTGWKWERWLVLGCDLFKNICLPIKISPRICKMLSVSKYS